MLRRIKRLWDRFQWRFGQIGVSRARRGRAVLTLEGLEDRTTPSALFTGTISGVVFADPSSSQAFNSLDSTLPGVLVTLTGTTTFDSTAIDQTATTGSNGTYQFLNVLPGTYQLSTGTVSGFQGSSVAQSGTFSVGDGQSLTENLGIVGGIGPQFISMLDFLTTTTPSDLPYAPAGSGQGLANYRADNDPTISKVIPTETVSTSSDPTQLDLAGFFTSPNMTNSEVTFNITNGGVPESLNVTLFDTTAPQTVANFFDYVNSGDYNNAIFSRLVSGFVLQGGGLKLSPSGDDLTSIPLNPAVPNEFGAANAPDTLAMALSSGNDNSATDQFFFNLVDNSSSLDPQNFTVFGQLADANSDATLNVLAATPVQNESTTSVATANPSVDLTDLPLTGFSGSSFPAGTNADNYMVINSITTDRRDQWLTYSATSSNPGLVTASVNNEWLTLNYAPDETGTSMITVQATDRYGATVDQTFEVVVKPEAPAIQKVAITPNSTTNITELTATPTSTDAQGLPVSYTYQWLQNGKAISGANSATLDLPADTKDNDTFAVEVTPRDADLTGAEFTSPPVTIASLNPTTIDLPSVQSVTIAPNSTTDVTTLTATATGDDPNDKALQFNYQWLKNGTAISGADSSTLTLPSDTAVSDTFSVEVTPGDGTLTGPMFTSKAVTVATVGPVTIDLPTVTSVAIAPDSATSATTLTATPVGTDPLGEALTYAYQWFHNGTAISGATSATLTIPSTSAVGDSFTVDVTPSDGTLTGTTFTSNPAVLATINPFTLKSPAIQSVTVAADNPADAKNLIATVNTSSPAAFAYQWFQDGTAISGANSATLSLSGLTIATGDQFTVQVTPSEGGLTGTAVTSGALSILSINPIVTTGDKAPFITSVAVTPDDPLDATKLTATPQSTDPEGVLVRYTYQWLENGSQLSGQTTDTLTLPAGVAAGTNFSVEVTPSDADGNTGPQFTSGDATISGTNPYTIALPTVESISIAPGTSGNSTTLTATPVGTDPNNAALTFSYQWFQNGNALAGNSAVLTLPADTLANDQFTVKVTPSDGTLTGTSVTSNPITVASLGPPVTFNPPAIQSVTIASNNPNNAAQLIATVDSTSPAVFSYEWFQNGQQITGATSATLNLSSLQSVSANDQFTVQVTPSEGSLTGTAVSSNTISVLSTPPIVTNG